MDVQLFYESVDKTNAVIEYRREEHICTGIGLLDVVFYRDSINGKAWDEVILYEGGNKKGTYIVSDYSKTRDGKIMVSCQDNSKKLIDYFRTEVEKYGHQTTAKFWIETILNEVGISYQFDSSGSGGPIAINAQFGLSTAYEEIVTLLQQSGWYIYFDPDGKAHIGKLRKTTKGYKDVLTEDEILRFKRNMNDSMLRNRAVIWGAPGIVVDKSVDTPWNYDALDKRAIVLAHGGIPNVATADSLATDMIKEFARITDEKEMDLAGAYDLGLGDTVFIDINQYAGLGTITSILSVMSKGGLITTLILDERCPRLFNYVGTGIGEPPSDSDYVHVSTNSIGIWRKPIDWDVWSDYSDGLEELNIIDLMITNGIFVCVADDGYAYTRFIIDTEWTKIEHGSFTDEEGTEYAEGDVEAIACTIARNTGVVYIGYRNTPNSRSWIMDLTSSFKLINKTQIEHDTGGSQNWLYDIDTDGVNLFATLKIVESLEGSGVCGGGELFVTYDLDDWTREWNSGKIGETSVAYHITNPVMCNNKIYYVYQPWYAPADIPRSQTTVKIRVDDFSFSPVDKTNSSEKTIVGDVFWCELYDENTLYFVTVDGTTIHRYRYEFITDFITEYSTTTALTTIENLKGFKNVIYSKEYPYIWFLDLFTGAAGNMEMEDGFCRYIFDSAAFDTIGFVWITTLSPPAHPYDYWGKGCDLLYVEDQNEILYKGRVFKATVHFAKIDLSGPSMSFSSEIIGTSETTHYSEGENIGGRIGLTEHAFFGFSADYNSQSLYASVMNYIYDNGYWWCNTDWGLWPPGGCDAHCNNICDSLGMPFPPKCYLGAIPGTFTSKTIINLTAMSATRSQVGSSGSAPPQLRYKRDERMIRWCTPGTYYGEEWEYFYSVGGMYFPVFEEYYGMAVNNRLMDANFNLLSTKVYNIPVDKMDYVTGKFYGIYWKRTGGGSYEAYLRRFSVGSSAIEAEMYLASFGGWGEKILKVYTGENVLALYKKVTPWSYGGVTKYQLKFYQFGEWVAGEKTTNATTVYNPTTKLFETLDTTQVPHKLDCSTPYLAATFPFPTPPDFLQDTIRTLTYPTPTFQHQEYLDEVGDIRAMGVSGEEITVSGGTHVPTEVGQLLATSEGYLKIVNPTSGDGWVDFATFDGQVSKLETSNYLDNPYLFVSVSGITLSGIFFQRQLGVEDSFTDYTNNLPSTVITSIRLDDLI
ncbi:hypothetical protein LCGC14_0609690 [marine sediment metagenome]|uniref:Uncharacterized protein n=1 Tax=marine sediment metagenome TaxID=412755 RepID=A0A0F9RS99_9ZZZZ